jgi:nitroimidazol reductase NimA-like FMN-containing flavoprotein (pyridoxamine 5'-phosphate oxidase superfamily)
MKTIWIEKTEEIEKIISECSICFVGTTSPEGIPYVIPMNFGYENMKIYLHSAQKGQAISFLEQNNNACITFCSDTLLKYQDEDVACSYRMNSKSVICLGKIYFEEDFEEKKKALNIIMRNYSEKTFTYNEPAVNNVKIWKMKIEKITAKGFGQPYY